MNEKQAFIIYCFCLLGLQGPMLLCPNGKTATDHIMGIRKRKKKETGKG